MAKAKQSEGVAEQLKQASRTKNNLQKRDFTLSDGTSGEATDVATYEAPRPVELRSDRPIKLIVPVRESFTTDGSGSQTINLANDIVESPNTQNIYILSNEGSGDPDTVVEASSVDYDGDSFDYDDGGSAEELDVWYIARDPGIIKIKKVAPQTQGSTEEVIYDEASSLLHTQDQFDDPVYLNLNQSDYQAVVPEDWDLVVTVDLPYTADMDTANAQLQLPAKFIQGNFEDELDQAVAHDIIDRNN